MRVVRKLWLVALAGAFSFTLAACDTAEERAEGHFQEGIKLLEAGDVDRALVEFRNVFKLNGRHREARLAYANAQRERGVFREAFGQYLRLVEQYPNDFEARIALAEMSFDSRNWKDLDTHASKAVEVKPDDLRAKSLSNVANYFSALRDKDDDARDAAISKAQTYIAENDQLKDSRALLVDDLIRRQSWTEALTQLDLSLELEPENPAIYSMRLSVLRQLGDEAGILAQLQEMVAKFPDNEQVKAMLVGQFIRAEQIDDAETFMRQQALGSEEAGPTVNLILFLQRQRDVETAMKELDTAINEARVDTVPLHSVRAQMKYARGERDEAIEELQSIIDGAERSEKIRAVEVVLARMLFGQGNSVGARALVENVLVEDPSQLEAVKLKANWLISDDETGDAIVMLRDALGLAPRDADLVTIMARAHEREGNRDLMMEMLSLAVDASGNAPEESRRYSSALVTSGDDLAAEGVLIDALRKAPANVPLLLDLGRLYIKMKDWPRTEGVIRRLGEIDRTSAGIAASELQAKSLDIQEKHDDLIGMLEGMAQDPASKLAAEIAIFRTRLQSKGPEDALEYLDGLMAERPDVPQLLYLKARAVANLGRFDEAEEIFRRMVDENPRRERVWTDYYILKRRADKPEEATAILQEALTTLPESESLNFALASEHERAGKFEDAIGVYEKLYERNSGSLVAANNLASLLADHRADTDSLQRAYTVARRLRETEIPAFRDTYGWIAYRMGNYSESLDYLRAAAREMADDARVQYHYGASLAQNNKVDEAQAQLSKAAEMAKDDAELLGLIQGEIEKLAGGSE